MAKPQAESDNSAPQVFTVSGSRDSGYTLRAVGKKGELAFSPHQKDVVKEGSAQARRVKGILKIERADGSGRVRAIHNYSKREKLHHA